MVWFRCCGHGTCLSCFKLNEEQGEETKMFKCPLCRSDFPSTYKEDLKLVKKCAEKGFPWAQYVLGNYHFDGRTYEQKGNIRVPLDRKRACELYNLAAKQDYPDAYFTLAAMHERGFDGVAEKSESTAKALYEKAANLGQKKSHEWYS